MNYFKSVQETHFYLKPYILKDKSPRNTQLFSLLSVRLQNRKNFSFYFEVHFGIAMWVGPRRLALALPVTQSEKRPKTKT